MRRLIAASLLAATFMGGGTALAEPVRLSLADAIKSAVEKNLDVRAEWYNPAQYEADINRARGIYDPVAALQTSYTDTTSLSAVRGSSQSEIQSFVLNSSLSQLFWTGATASVGFNNTYTTTNSLSALSNYWQTDLSATITQPLLRNAGREATELSIGVARLSKFASLEHLNSRLLALVAQVRNEYYKLYSVREALEVKKVSLELARKILAETQARVKAGVLPSMEILNAEFGVVSREKDVIDAEKAVADQVDVVRLLLQLEGKGDIVAADAPGRTQVEVSEEQARIRALVRPDIKEQKRNLEIEELKTRVYSNKSLPDLSLSAKAGLTGLDRTYPRDFDKVTTFDYPYWSVGLSFSYPLGNGAADNDYRKSRLKAEQVALQVRSLEEGVGKELRAVVRAVASSFKQIEVADRGRSFAEERLRAFIRKNEVGLATTKDVLDVENDLAAAKNNQIAAVVGYANALTALWQATGELLEKEHVVVVEKDADRLYRNLH